MAYEGKKVLTQDVFKGQPSSVDWCGVDYDGLLSFGTKSSPRYTWASERWRGFELVGERTQNSGYKALTSLTRILQYSMRKKGLNLYAGLGGNRKKWENVDVTALEFEPKIAAVYQELHPNDTVVIGDAHQYLLDHHKEFDFVWSSPPCQTHSKMAKATRHELKRYSDMNLYQEILFLQHFFKGDWIVENVVPYYKPLIEPTMRIGRHLFWSNKPLFGIQDVKRPSGFINSATVAESQKLKDWLGIQYEGNIYYKNNHCPGQVLRNCVHPDLGLQLYNSLIQ